MTEENYKYRLSLLRNQFKGEGKYSIPVIPKFEANSGDFDDLLLLGFDRTSLADNKYLDRMAHFFLYDYKFEKVWNKPDEAIKRLSRYRAVLSPDFSMYVEMAPIVQLYNVFRNRWCGAYFASKGIRVVPTVNWGDESTFDFCFDGIEKGSTVAVSTYMASAHDGRKDQKDLFMPGYNEMLRRIQPERIICYNTPFEEMQGNIVYVDYERSSWRYMDREQKSGKIDLSCYKIGGADYENSDIINPYLIGNVPAKGFGSARGGGWMPSKKDDERLLGEPGTIKTTTKNNGEVFLTKIGDDGRATKERHLTDHNKPWAHTSPHDHVITWDTPDGHPEWGEVINYPDGAPEFKSYTRSVYMSGEINYYGSWKFDSISEFKERVNHGYEIEFRWKGVYYFITACYVKGKIIICEENKQETEKWYDTADEVLEYKVGGDRLRDVITQVEVI